ncbi:Transposase [Shigella dysenteriae 1617]|uniref:Transposase n=1 Tax=Shigella dysenteriae 1617 TaxID=754093 RepID=A0A0A7A1Z4_SHIDY|nr:Transposase [Shigella dysenteriae 1617]
MPVHLIKKEQMVVSAIASTPHSVIREYIEIFYNRQRRHSRLGNISPAAFREKYHQMAVLKKRIFIYCEKASEITLLFRNQHHKITLIAT